MNNMTEPTLTCPQLQDGDITKMLQNLVRKGFLVSDDKRRWTRYHLPERHQEQHDSKGLFDDLPGVELQPESRPESQPESLDQRVLASLQQGPLSKAELSSKLGQKEVSGQLNKVIRGLVRQGIIEPTIPDKPKSRLQKYRLTPAGAEVVRKKK